MEFTYNPKTDIGMVRLLCTDTDEKHAMFSDEDIRAFLDLEGDVKLAAARALETIANSQTLILKVIRTLDTQTNGPQVAADLRNAAQQLRQESEDEAGIAIAETVYDVFGAREKLIRDATRHV